MGGGGSTYDYGFRIYNPQIGRFLSIDPLSNKFPFYTPYQFAGNKPIVAVDLDGREDVWVHELTDYGTNKRITTTRTVNAEVKKQIVAMLGYDPDPNNEGGVLVSSEVSGDGKTYSPGHNMTKPVVVIGSRSSKEAGWYESGIFAEGGNDGANAGSDAPDAIGVGVYGSAINYTGSAGLFMVPDEGLDVKFSFATDIKIPDAGAGVFISQYNFTNSAAENKLSSLNGDQYNIGASYGSVGLSTGASFDKGKKVYQSVDVTLGISAMPANFSVGKSTTVGLRDMLKKTVGVQPGNK